MLISWEKEMRERVLGHIVYALQYEQDKTINDISREYGVGLSTVRGINSGALNRIPGKTYPLRAETGFLKKESASGIKDALKNHPEMSQKDIARAFNVSVVFVSDINRGKFYRDEETTYPIRENYQGNRKTFDFSEIRMIEGLLLRGTPSIREIARQFETSTAMIQNLNSGSVKAYRNEKLRYPLRDTRRRHLS